VAHGARGGTGPDADGGGRRWQRRTRCDARGALRTEEQGHC
jgi:hypothetical protein